MALLLFISSKYSSSQLWTGPLLFIQIQPGAFLNTVTLRYRPVEQGDRAAGDAVCGVPDEAQPVGADLRGEQATVCRLQL